MFLMAFVEPSSSSTWCLNKTVHGNYAVIIVRVLNAAIIPDKYPLPHIQDFTSSLYGQKYFFNKSREGIL